MCAVRTLCLFALPWMACDVEGRPNKLPNDTFLGGELLLSPSLPRPQNCTLFVAIPGNEPLQPIALQALSHAAVNVQRPLGEVVEDSSLFWLTDEEVEAYASSRDLEWQAWVGCVDGEGAESWGAAGGEEAVPFEVPSDELSIEVDLLGASEP